MVEEVQTHHLLDAAELLPAIWTGSSYVTCVDFMVLVQNKHLGLIDFISNWKKSSDGFTSTILEKASTKLPMT